MKKKIKKTKEVDFELTPVPAERLIAFTKWLMKQSNEPPSEEVKEMNEKQIESVAMTMLDILRCEKCDSYTCWCRKTTPNEFFESADSKEWNDNREAIENYAKDFVYHESMYDSAWRNYDYWPDVKRYNIVNVNNQDSLIVPVLAHDLEMAEYLAKKMCRKRFHTYKVVLDKKYE